MELKPKEYFSTLLDHHIKVAIIATRRGLQPFDATSQESLLWMLSINEMHLNRFTNGRTHSPKEGTLLEKVAILLYEGTSKIIQRLYEECSGMPITIAYGTEELIYLEMMPGIVDEIYQVYLDAES